MLLRLLSLQLLTICIQSPSHGMRLFVDGMCMAISPTITVEVTKHVTCLFNYAIFKVMTYTMEMVAKNVRVRDNIFLLPNLQPTVNVFLANLNQDEETYRNNEQFLVPLAR